MYPCIIESQYQPALIEYTLYADEIERKHVPDGDLQRSLINIADHECGIAFIDWPSNNQL